LRSATRKSIQTRLMNRSGNPLIPLSSHPQMNSDALWNEKRRALESEYAAHIGLTREDLETLAELVPFVSRDEIRPRDHLDTEETEKCYRARFEAAEQRYGRMKALLCASLEAQMRLRSEQRGRFVVESLRDLGLGDHMAVETILGQKSLNESSRRQMVEQIWELACELKRAKEEIAVLSKRCLQLPETMEVESADDTVSELAAARKRIAALDLELNRLNEKSFSDDERVRECEDVFDRILGRTQADSDGVHPKYHPMTTCQDPKCQNYAKRLRNGLKQAVAEAYVRERSVRIHGYFRYQVEPLERLRLEKDREIESLRFQLKRLEHATSSENVTIEELDMEKVIRKVEIDTLSMSIKKLKDENRTLAAERDRWSGVIVGLQEDVRCAEATIEECRSTKARLQMEMEAFESRKPELEQLIAQLEQFKTTGILAAYQDQLLAMDKVTQEISMAQKCLEELQQEAESYNVEDTTMEDATAKKPSSFLIKNGSPIYSLDSQGGILVLCKCDKQVALDGMREHVASEHTADVKKPGIICPSGCGYFVAWDRSGDMGKHVKGQACAERVKEIQRLLKQEA